MTIRQRTMSLLLEFETVILRLLLKLLPCLQSSWFHAAGLYLQKTTKAVRPTANADTFFPSSIISRRSHRVVPRLNLKCHPYPVRSLRTILDFPCDSQDGSLPN
mmetsp:Transcript_16334/g.24169  ORF Transcript_16334/g.24169 Transcript_16334/m.24169 type:complete len:104 (-) Transcript_16334:179-490(-)